MDKLRRIAEYIETPDDHTAAMAAGRDQLRSHIEQSIGSQQAEQPSSAVGTDAATAGQTVGRGRAGRLPRRWITGTAAAIAAAVVAFAIIVLPAEQVTALGTLAEVVETLPNDAFAGAAIERHTTSRWVDSAPIDVTDPDSEKAVFRVATEETRRTSTDDMIQVETHILGVEFLTDLTAEDEATIEELVGAGTVDTYTYPIDEDHQQRRQKLSDDPVTLEESIRRDIERWGNLDVPDDIEVFEAIIDIHRVYVLTPAERAATLHVLADLPELTSTADGTSVHVLADYETSLGREQRTATFDNEGWLTAETHTYHDGIPDLIDGPVLGFQATYKPPTSVTQTG
ncbi:MAG: hypothetical protein ABFR95_04180 [Actinomycetota bacterium]